MRLQVTRSKNSCTYYVAKSFRTLEGKYSSKIVEKLGSFEDLVERFGPDDPEGAAKAYAVELGRRERESREKVRFELSTSKLVKNGERNGFNIGYLFLQNAYHKFGLDKICNKISKKHKAEFDLNEILKLLVYTRVLYPGSKQSSLEDAENFVEQPSVELHQIYRGLSLLASESETLQAGLFKNSLKVMKRNTGVIYYDCTNYFFESEEEGGLRQYGRSKENRPNPIVQMGMFMDMDGMPLAFCINPGNTNEQVTLKPLETTLHEKFGISKMVVCTDAGLSSYENRLHNDVGERAYITVQSLKRLRKDHQEWALKKDGWKMQCWDRYGNPVDNGKLYDISELDEGECYDRTFYKETWVKDKVKTGGVTQEIAQRLIVTYSIKYRNYLSGLRERQVARAEAKIEKGASSVEKKSQNGPSRFIKQTSCTNDGEEAAITSYSIDQDMIDQESRFDGFYAVATDLEDIATDILKFNSYRWQIEDGFRITKTDFKSRPVYLRRDERIKAHFLTCFLALFLTKYLLKRVNLAKGKDELFSVHELIKTLKNMNMTFIGGEGYLPAYTRTELTNRLHGSAGFRTDYQITTKRMMNTIIAQTKNAKAEK